MSGWYSRHHTPWARDALHAAGITQADLDAMTPEGWHVAGHGRSSRGPWTFQLISDRGIRPMQREATVTRVDDIRSAIAGLLASVTPDLETQLANSLAVLEGKG